MSDNTKFSRLARKVTDWSGSVWATGAAFALIVAWTVGGFFVGFGDFYQIIINTVTTIITFLMVFLIQHTQNHDTKALHLKIDQLILKMEDADNSFIKIENLTDEKLDYLARQYDAIRKKADDRVGGVGFGDRS